MSKAWKIGLAAYVAAAVFTFGSVAGSSQKEQCNVIKNGHRLGHNMFDYDILKPCPYGVIAVGSAPAAVLWPLYWSWELQS